MSDRIFVAGRYAHGDGYPHVTGLLAALRAERDLEVVDLGGPLGGTSLHDSSRHGRLALLARMAGGVPASLVRLLWRCRRDDVAFLPYPAVPLLFLLSFVPLRWRPRLVADAFISLWDTVVVDRRRWPEGALRARLLKAAERRALATADVVMVDTVENAAYLSERFALQRSKLHAVPLATLGQATSPTTGHAHCEVLFVGTFVPLHGVEVIFDAIRHLRDHPTLRFTMLGDGQTADQFAALLAEDPLPNLDWNRRWHSQGEVGAAIANADVCLGIFGGAGKAARVLPLKLYAYLAAGKAIVTQSAHGTPGTPPIPARFADDARSLAQVLAALADDPAERDRLGRCARAYFDAHLSTAKTVERFRALVRTASTSAP